MLLQLLISCLVSSAQAYNFAFNRDGRRRLLEAYRGTDMLPATLKRVDMGLSNQLAPDTPGVESIQQQDDAELRGLRVAFYDRLDETRTELERDYIMNKLMPATATMLSRSLRVREPSGKLPLSGFLDEQGEPIPGDPEGVLQIHRLNSDPTASRCADSPHAQLFIDNDSEYIMGLSPGIVGVC